MIVAAGVLRAVALLALGQRDLRPVLAALVRRALQHLHRQLRVVLGQLLVLVRVVAGEAGRVEGDGRLPEALEDALDDRLAVDGVGHRQADLLVVERRHLDVRHEVPGARQGELDHLLAELRIGLDPLDLAERPAVDPVDLVVLVGEQRCAVFDDRPDDRVHLDVLGVPVVVVLLHLVEAVVLPLGQLVRAVPDAVRGLGPLVAELLDGRAVGRHRGVVRDQGREVAARPFQCRHQGRVVRRP